MVVEGHRLVVANGLGIEGGYQVDVAAGGSLGSRPDTWMAADPGTTTTIQPGATLELNGDGGYYRELGRRAARALTNNGTAREDRRHGHQRRRRDVPRAADRSIVHSGTLALPDGQSWSARSV